MKNTKITKVISFFSVIILLSLSFYYFWIINNKNYKIIKEIKYKQVKHPEFIAKSNFAKITSFWFTNIKADLYRLETIQYIWWNAISSEYKKYLYKMINLITDLNPYFVSPYKIAMLLLPDYNPRYENLTDKEQIKYIKQAEKIWLKWIKNFCDKNKINLILQENNLQKIWSEDKYKNPCKKYIIPYYLAYIYYFYLHNPSKSADYYKIASANTDSLDWAKILAAIMRWKWWDREKAFLMFINMWKTLDTSKNKYCKNFAWELENLWYKIFRKKILNYKLIKYINEKRKELFWMWDTQKNYDKNQCIDYVNKATREINLFYIEQANKKYRKDHNWKNAKNAKILYDDWYIKYLPIDYQQFKDYWIIYFYNKDTKHFDYQNGRY